MLRPLPTCPSTWRSEWGWPLQLACYSRPRKGRCSGHPARTLHRVSQQQGALVPHAVTSTRHTALTYRALQSY